jgi:hypothetical protein
LGITNRTPGRLSLPNFTNEPFLDDDPTEDWTRTTAEEDSWAHRERRRSSMRLKMDSYPSLYSADNSPSRSRSRRGSILSLFTHGKDKYGHDAIFSGEGNPEDWHVQRRSECDAVKTQNLPINEPSLVREGAILTPWIRGKDSQGRKIVLWVEIEGESTS